MGTISVIRLVAPRIFTGAPTPYCYFASLLFLYGKLNCEQYISKLKSPSDNFDFAFLDSMTPIRAKEFNLLYERQLLNNLVAFHDSSRYREKTFVLPGEPQDVYLNEIDQIEKLYCNGGIETNLSRGFRLMQIAKLFI